MRVPLMLGRNKTQSRPFQPVLTRWSRRIVSAVVLISWVLPAQARSDMAVVVNSDGGAEIVVAKPLYVAHQWEGRGQDWTKYAPGGSNIVAARDTAGRLMFAWLATGQLMFTGSPAPRAGMPDPVSLMPGKYLSVLNLVKQGDGRILLIAMSKDGVHAKQQRVADSWEWENAVDLGGRDLRGISATSNGGSKVAVVALGGDRHLYLITKNGTTWGSWEYFGGQELRDAQITSNADGRLEIIALGGDLRLWHRYELVAGGWSDWEVMSQVPAGDDFKVFRDERGVLSLWASNGHYMSQSGPNGGWSDWDWNAQSQADPGAIAIGPDGSLVHARLDVSTTTKQAPNPYCQYNKENGRFESTPGTPCPPYFQTTYHHKLVVTRGSQQTVLTEIAP